MPLTVRQDNRKNTATALSTMFFTSHAQVSSSRYVHFAPGRAPRHMRDQHTVLRAPHPRRRGLQERASGPGVHRPPPPGPDATVVPRARPPTRRTPTRRPDVRAHRHHQNLVAPARIDLDRDVLDDHALDAQQLPEYPGLAHAVPFPSFRSLSKTKITAEHGMSPQNPRSGTHYNVTRAGGLLQGQQSTRNARECLVHVLGVHLPSSASAEQTEGHQLHVLSTRDEPGQADREESGGSPLAASPAAERHSGRPRPGDQPDRARVDGLLGPVLPDRDGSPPHTHQHLPDAMGAEEVPAVEWVQASEGVVARGRATRPHAVRALGMDSPVPADWVVRAE